MKIYEQVSALLAKHGTDTMFGLMGDANMYVAGAFENGGGRFVRVAHEAGAVAMADGYARMSGRPGVATVTHGPGVTNSLTALMEAQRFPSPVLLITGDTPPEATHLQRMDIAAVCASLGVAHEYVHRPESVGRDVGRAVRRLQDGPVVLNLPLGLGKGEATPGAATVQPAPAPAPAEPSDLDAALGLIASASRPVVLAGRGALAAGPPLQELADLLGAPLFTTALGRGLFADHPRHLGIMGSLSHELAVQVLADADCIVAFGATLNKYTTMAGELVAGKHLVQVDTDPVKLGWLVEPDEAVVGDAAIVASRMVESLREAEVEPARAWSAQAEQTRRSVGAWVPDDQGTASTVDVRIASRVLNEVLPDHAAVVSDVGRFVAGVWPYLDRVGPGDFTAMTGFGSIGLGLAAGTGAAIARQGRGPVVVLVGDGGFMMNASELSTAVRERLPLVVVVLNDGAYGAEYMKLVAEGFDAAASYNVWPDLAEVARGLGAAAHTARSADELRELAPALRRPEGPVVVDVRLDPTHHIPF
ncbi:thiamine pyrophosphate-binding protein [Nocardioides carbamazepini]|uniref:thiamine pyrophosphate-binding protein n=1 Tax=Nocardioides carbamazepini TaxID=2854259 RepID=UPI00214A7EF4|nr:thiamine pyrophosphate-binding protein [Nocardioides carbamazepini]MCR1783782.1 thiamine pyrophosphate-binding protein [Nocardioides carbamazepini]